MTAGPSRSARSPCTRACERGRTIEPRLEPEDAGRRETATREAHRAIEAIWRIESARLIAGLARLVGDIGTAWELAHDPPLAAPPPWATAGGPEKPRPLPIATPRHDATALG